jgi:predicted GNAT superfamily acetyltransferase
MPATPTIRTATVADYLDLYGINQASTPGVGSVALDDFPALMALGAASWVAVVDDDLAGFVHVMVEGTPYSSPNYRWVAERYPTFAYIDRVAVAPNHRGAGIGARLYDAVVARFSCQRTDLLCEVNLAPPNPASVRFHERYGFRAVGERWTDDRTKGVVFLRLSMRV